MSDDEFMWEYAIFREDGSVDMDGQPRTVRIVNTSFHNLKSVQQALEFVPSLKDKSIVIARRKVTSWEVIDNGTES